MYECARSGPIYTRLSARNTLIECKRRAARVCLQSIVSTSCRGGRTSSSKYVRSGRAWGTIQDTAAPPCRLSRTCQVVCMQSRLLLDEAVGGVARHSREPIPSHSRPSTPADVRAACMRPCALLAFRAECCAPRPYFVVLYASRCDAAASNCLLACMLERSSSWRHQAS
jgi:hypothetical protein